MTTGDILFTALYAFAFTLFECLIFLLILLLLAFILPGKLFRERFLLQGTGFVLLTSAVMIFIQNIALIINEWQADQFIQATIAAVIFFGAAFIILFLLAKYVKAYVNLINFFADRIIVFLYVYIPLNLLGLVVVFLRNLN